MVGRYSSFYIASQILIVIFTIYKLFYLLAYTASFLSAVIIDENKVLEIAIFNNKFFLRFLPKLLLPPSV
jgi:hypothetical protein